MNTFKLPDLRGRTAVSLGQRPGASAYALGQTNGTDSATLTTNRLPAHTHTITGGNTGSTGGGTAFDNRQPTLAMKWLISSTGFYPSSGFTPFIGELRFIAGNAAPGLGLDWLAADGTLHQISSYPDLYSVLGTVYGGDGMDTVGVPDLRGRVAVGLGQGVGTSNYSIGQFAGQESVTLTTNQMPTHMHSAPSIPPVPPPHLKNVTVTNGQFTFAFTNIASQTFTVIATTNVALPVSNWTVLGSATEGPFGQFQFTDPQATNNARRFYRVRWP